MAKTGYRFNPETLSYDRIHVSVKKKLWSLVVKFFSSLSLALVIFLIVSAIVDSPKEKALKREKGIPGYQSDYYEFVYPRSSSERYRFSTERGI